MESHGVITTETNHGIGSNIMAYLPVENHTYTMLGCQQRRGQIVHDVRGMLPLGLPPQQQLTHALPASGALRSSVERT
jgi:hypothetical protein